MTYTDIDPLPPTDKQMAYARLIATRLGEVIPWESARDRRALSDWISAHQTAMAPRRGSGGGATSRQVAYAEKIARRKRRAIPEECFRDAGLMSHWIDANR